MQPRPVISTPSTANRTGTAGVNMRLHPLSLGDDKLHSAVNLRFEEGVIRTRPGFRYQRLGLSGQFQGGLFYAPSRGLSARPFAANNTALIIAVDGVLSTLATGVGELSCPQTLQGDYTFAGRGPVNLFQAENWLVVQNRLSSTFFWDGVGPMVKSPGMADALTDTDTPLDPLPDTPPVAIPYTPVKECVDPDLPTQFFVTDQSTGLPLEGVVISLRIGGLEVYTETTGESGEATFFALENGYTYVASLDGYNDLPGSLVVLRSGCQTVRIGLLPLCGFSINNITIDEDGEGAFTVTNTQASGDVTLTAYVGPGVITSPVLPLVIPFGGSQVFAVDPDGGELFDADFTIVANGCERDAAYRPAQCSFSIGSITLGLTGEFIVTNNNTIDDITITTYAGAGVVLSPVLPVTIAAGDTQAFEIDPDGADLSNTGFSLVAELCGSSAGYTFPEGPPPELPVTLNFFVYGSSYSESTENVFMTGSVESGIFVGVCSKGPFTLLWNPGGPEWVISFDTPVPTTGDGDVTPWHGEMTIGILPGDPESPNGFYVQMDSVPFPNWTAVVPTP